MTIPSLPAAPSPTDTPAEFNSKASAFLTALDPWGDAANALADTVNADAANAEAAAASATAVSNVSKWVSGTTYAEGVATWSPITYLTYRRKVTGGGTTDPSLDSANWALVVGQGDVTSAGVQTLTNKTLVGVILDGGYTEEVAAMPSDAITSANGSLIYRTLSGNTTFTDGLAEGQSVLLRINPGAFVVTWPTTSWVTATAPALSASANNIIVFWKMDGVLYANYIGVV
jgi:hypothetical protein